MKINFKCVVFSGWCLKASISAAANEGHFMFSLLHISCIFKTVTSVNIDVILFIGIYTGDILTCLFNSNYLDAGLNLY